MGIGWTSPAGRPRTDFPRSGPLLGRRVGAPDRLARRLVLGRLEVSCCKRAWRSNGDTASARGLVCGGWREFRGVRLAGFAVGIGVPCRPYAQ